MPQFSWTNDWTNMWLLSDDADAGVLLLLLLPLSPLLSRSVVKILLDALKGNPGPTCMAHSSGASENAPQHICLLWDFKVCVCVCVKGTMNYLQPTLTDLPHICHIHSEENETSVLQNFTLSWSFCRMCVSVWPGIVHWYWVVSSSCEGEAATWWCGHEASGCWGTSVTWHSISAASGNQGRTLSVNIP